MLLNHILGMARYMACLLFSSGRVASCSWDYQSHSLTFILFDFFFCGLTLLYLVVLYIHYMLFLYLIVDSVQSLVLTVAASTKRPSFVNIFIFTFHETTAELTCKHTKEMTEGFTVMLLLQMFWWEHLGKAEELCTSFWGQGMASGSSTPSASPQKTFLLLASEGLACQCHEALT